MRPFLLALLFAPLAAFASGPFTSLHPEEFIPPAVETGSPDVYQGFISQVQEKLIALGFEPEGNTPAEFAAQMRSELAKWAKVIKAAKIVVE